MVYVKAPAPPIPRKQIPVVDLTGGKLRQDNPFGVPLFRPSPVTDTRALAAHSAGPVAAPLDHVSVLRRVRMSLGAVGFGSVDGSGRRLYPSEGDVLSSGVFGGRNRLKVQGVPAGSGSAEVVEVQASRDRAYKYFVHNSMRLVSVSRRHADASVAVYKAPREDVTAVRVVRDNRSTSDAGFHGCGGYRHTRSLQSCRWRRNAVC